MIKNDIGTLQLSQLSHQTLLEWINKMKERRLKPGSTSKRVGVLARAFDIAVHRELLKINVVRALPRGYANYGFSSVLCGKWVQTGTGFWKGLAGRFASFPTVRKMMFVRLRNDLNPLALTMAA